MAIRESFGALTQGVDTLDFTGSAIPCELLLIGDKAFPVVVSDSGQVLIAASQYGKGRIVAIAHETYLNSPKFSQFLLNAVLWLKPSADALVGIQSNLDSLVKTFSDKDIKVQSTGVFQDSFGVYCMDAYDASQKKELIAFVKKGGGLLIAGQAWPWANKNSTKNVCFQFPGNRVINVSGIYFTSNHGDRGVFSISKKVPICPLLVRHGIDFIQDLRSLLAGVTDLHIENEAVPSQLLVHGLLAFPVALDDSHQSFLAAAYYGKGRVVVATHERQLNTPYLKTFLLNAISWLDAGRQGKIGIESSLKGLNDLLNENKVPSGISDLIPSLSVYCCQSYSDSEVRKIHKFVAEGGGLLIGGKAWWWAHQHPGQYAAAEYPGNKILNTFGISILGKFLKAGTYKPMKPEDVTQVYHFRRALSRFLQDNSGKDTVPSPSPWLQKLGQDCTEFVKLSPGGSSAVSSIHQMLKNLLHHTKVPTVSKDKPIQNNSNESVLIQLATSLHDRYTDLSDVILTIDAKNEGFTAWRSTGLYLYPLQNASIVFPPAAIGADLQVQIGCHSDDLSNKEELFRPPVVIKIFKVKSLALLCMYKMHLCFGVYCMDAYDASQKKELIAFVKKGGGLLIAGQAWPWANKNSTKNVCFQFPGNRVINVSGIYFTSNHGDRGVFSISKKVPICPLLVRHGIDFIQDLRSLLAGVTDLHIENEAVPSQLLVHGLLAFPVALDDSHQSFLAAAYYGKGRVVVATHERQLNTPYLKTFLLNAISWLDAGRQGKIGIESSLKGLNDLLNENKVPSGISDLIPSLSVYCCQSYSDSEVRKIHKFVAEGGGLLIGGKAWWWAHQHPGQYAAAEYPGNKILNTFGISILGKFLKAGTYKPMKPEDVTQVYHFRRALSRFLQDNSGKDTVPSPSPWLQKLGQDCTEFVKLSPGGSSAVSSIHQMLKNLLHHTKVPTVSKDKPIQNNSNESVLIQLATSLHDRYTDLSDVILTIDAKNEGMQVLTGTAKLPLQILSGQTP
ncbi:TRPM8 channel-associated factor homolog [Pleurodeles waltl]|uniref:TRPM8 channel-associated factor homolog n=1 Tax=Pleurodeles waltl TaxID=8319 RepID=UPI00370951FE